MFCWEVVFPLWLLPLEFFFEGFDFLLLFELFLAEGFTGRDLIVLYYNGK